MNMFPALRTFFLAIVSLGAVLSFSPQAQGAQAVESLVSCQFKMFAVANDAKLPYAYDGMEIANSSSVAPEDNLVYSFIVNTKDAAQKSLTGVTFQQVSGGKEPIEILDVQPQNGSCTTDAETKSVSCTLSYSFTDSTHYPIEYLVKMKGGSQETTSSLFSVTTTAGAAQCANWLKIKPQAPSVHPITWETPYSRLSAKDFFIRIGNQKFLGAEPVYLHSDPGVEATTLEATWQENGVEMRLFLYFRRIENGMWELYDIRSYNGKKPGDWVYYRESLGNRISSLVGYHNFRDRVTFMPTIGNIDAEISCTSCDINAFMPKPVQLSPAGYSLEALIGNPSGEVITLSTDPMTGYGINVLLRDNAGETVKSQAAFSYQWKAEPANVVAIDASTLQYNKTSCIYDILPPCPLNHADLRGLSPGQTTITVTVTQTADRTLIAQTSFPVKVIEDAHMKQLPTLSPSTTLAPDQEELLKVKRDLERVKEELASQQKSLNLLEQIVATIREFLEKFFGRPFSN